MKCKRMDRCVHRNIYFSWLLSYFTAARMWNVSTKVRAPIPPGYAGFYTVYYKDIGEFQILYSQDICW
jgi:hypothetical protein